MQASELILNPDGSIYHLHLVPDQIAQTIITVGDPDRVGGVSKYFDRIDERVSKREFVTHTGELNGKRLSVISTGIGTDNIDIVFNELDALVNIDLSTRQVKENLRSLQFIRIGTSGALRPELGVDTWLASSGAVGLEGLLNYYQREQDAIAKTITKDLTLLLRESADEFPLRPYYSPAPGSLYQRFVQEDQIQSGITLTAAGFYAPQGRELRLKSSFNHALLDRLIDWSGYEGQRITNLEMETAGIYGMAHLLGHEAVSLNALLANRAQGTFSKQAGKTVDDLIQFTLQKLTE